jgi:hypothetical protein
VAGLRRKRSGGHYAKRRKEGEKKTRAKPEESPRNTKACHRVNTILLQSVAEMGTQSTMKICRKTLHEFTLHIPKKRRKGAEVVDERNVENGHNSQSARSESRQHPCEGSDEMPPK